MAEITFTPAVPVPGRDGVHFTVTGEVPVLAHLQISDVNEKIIGVSPVFKMGLNPVDGGAASNEITIIAFTGDPGSFTVEVTDEDENVYVTGPVYMYDDEGSYTYPDSDALSAALLEVLPSGAGVVVARPDAHRVHRDDGPSKP
jgi:hypothetical protein